jgi:hypothetical protein
MPIEMQSNAMGYGREIIRSAPSIGCFSVEDIVGLVFPIVKPASSQHWRPCHNGRGA